MTATAPAWIFSALVLTAPLSDTLSLMTLCFLVTAAGGTLGGYLVARRTFQAPLRMAVFSGIGSYGLLAIVDWLLRVPSTYDMVAIIGFPAGFAIGARLIELSRLKKPTTSKEMRRPKK